MIFFLVNAVFFVDSIGLIIYHYSGFSVMKDYFPKIHLCVALSIIIIMLVMLLLQGLDFQGPLLTTVSLTIIFLSGLSLFTIKKHRLIIE